MTGRILRLAAATAVLLASSAWADVAVPKRGPLLRGAIRVDVKSRSFTCDGETKSLADFLVIEKDDGTLVWASDFSSRLKGYERAVFQQRRKKLIALTKEAVRAKSLDVSLRLLKWAQSEGLDGKDERLLKKRVDGLARKPGRLNQKRLEPVLRDEQRLRGQLSAALMKRAKLASGVDGLRLLRKVLDLGPDDAAALQLLAEKAPEKHPFEHARAWLDWTLDLEPRGFKLAPADLVELKRAKFKWRPDLYGVMSDRILLITSITDLKVVAECALRADAVVAELSKLFATPKPLIRAKGPIRIHLFENKENFRERVGYRRVAAMAPYFGWVHGKWNEEEDVTKIWCEMPYNRWVGWTLVHEVARHWLASRCPRYSSKQLSDAPATSGFGVVAGVYQMFADAPFNTRTARFDLTSHDTNAFKILKVVPAAQRHPWRKFFLMDWEDLHLANSRDPVVHGKAPKGQWLTATVFQAQGVVVAHYLYNARSGSKRRALIEYVTNQYKGDRPKLAPPLAFGMSADEFGRAVMTYALR